MKNYNYNNTPPLKNIVLKKSPSLDTKFIKNDNNYLETKKCQNNVKGNSSKIKPKTTQMINNENNKITSTQNKKKKKSDGKIDIKKNINFDKLNSTSKTISGNIFVFNILIIKEINLDNIKEGSIIKSKLYEKPQLNNLNQYDLYKSNRKIFIPNLSRKQKIIDLSGYDTNKNIM